MANASLLQLMGLCLRKDPTKNNFVHPCSWAFRYDTCPGEEGKKNEREKREKETKENENEYWKNNRGEKEKKRKVNIYVCMIWLGFFDSLSTQC